MPLQIRSQGFPNILNALGVVQPLQGPFWGFEPTVVPNWQVGSNPLETSLGAVPYLPEDLLDVTVIAPAASATLIQTPNLKAGSYIFQINFTFINNTAGGGVILYKVRDVGGTVLRTTSICAMGSNAAPGSVGFGENRFIEQLNLGDFIFIENLFALAGSDVRVTCRWARLGERSFSF